MRLRRSLKTLTAISDGDALHTFADELMLQTLGIMTLTWAIMERALDDIVAAVFATDHDQVVQPTLPVTLDNKLDYLRRARAQMAWLGPFIPQMSDLQRRIKLARTHRKNITHGTLEVADEDRHVWRAKVLDFKGAASTETTVRYGAKALFKTIHEIDEIASDLRALSDDVRATIDTA